MVRAIHQTPELAEVCRRNRIARLAVFGSVATGSERADSDIDLLVDFDADAEIGMVAFGSAMLDLEAYFGRKVDLVTRNGLHPRLRDQILAQAEVIFAAR